ncbi:ATP synthase subunit I [Bradyrhizobium oligotrophicum S58]
MSHSVMREYLFIAEAVGWFGAGALLGLLHFASLRWNVRFLIGGQLFSSLGLQLLRFAATGGAMVLVTRWFGAMPLLAGTFGLMAARYGLLRPETRR